MKVYEKNKMHKLYGNKVCRVNYQSGDFADYLIMLLFFWSLMHIIFEQEPAMMAIVTALSLFLCISFILRHGFELKVPIILKRPQDIFLSLYYRFQNVRWVYIAALLILSAENLIIYFTPDLPHNVEFMREAALWLLWIHFGGFTLYRTAILLAHLIKKEHARNVLTESPVKYILAKQKSMTLHIFHAYVTGLLTHIAFIAPWYMVIQHLNFSILLFPFTCVINIFILFQFLKILPDHFYREHWIAHNFEFDFVYSHGAHHDAIPTALIGVSGSGFYESFMQAAVAYPTQFYNPLMAFIYYSGHVYIDMGIHQFIPGIFPEQPRELAEHVQHSRHHYGKLEPYGSAIKWDSSNVTSYSKKYKFLPDELKYSISIDEQMNGYNWDNREQSWYLSLVDKYGSKSNR